MDYRVHLKDATALSEASGQKHFHRIRQLVSPPAHSAAEVLRIDDTQQTRDTSRLGYAARQTRCRVFEGKRRSS
jgi:hypothetical protein